MYINVNGNFFVISFFMKIGSILENQNVEKRIAITPEIVKKYISLGFDICLSENYGSHLGIKDKDYLDLGARILKDDNEILNSSEIILQLGMLNQDKCSLLKENQTIIGILDPYNNKQDLENLAKKNKPFFTGIASKNNKSTIYGHFIISGKLSRLQSCGRVICKF